MVSAVKRNAAKGRAISAARTQKIQRAKSAVMPYAKEREQATANVMRDRTIRKEYQVPRRTVAEETARIVQKKRTANRMGNKAGPAPTIAVRQRWADAANKKLTDEANKTKPSKRYRNR